MDFLTFVRVITAITVSRKAKGRVTIVYPTLKIPKALRITVAVSFPFTAQVEICATRTSTISIKFILTSSSRTRG